MHKFKKPLVKSIGYFFYFKTKIYTKPNRCAFFRSEYPVFKNKGE